MTKQTDARPRPRTGRKAVALLALSVLCVALAPAAAFAQWTQPTQADANIRNTNDGNVGVGTGQTAPSERLVVVGNILAGNVTTRTRLYQSYDSQANSILELGYATATASITPFASFVMSKNLSGAPAGGNVVGTLSFVNSGLADGGDKRLAAIQAWSGETVTSGSLRFFVADGGTFTERMRLAPSGRLGLGTAAPKDLLHVEGGQLYGLLRVSGTGLAALNLRDNGAGPDAKFYQIRSDSGLFRLNLVNDAEQDFVRQNIIAANSSGNVGVGTDRPAGLLHVYSTSDGPHAVNIDAQGAGANQQATINFVTLGDGSKTVLGAGTRGWHLTARGNAFANAAQQNDLMLYSWDNSSSINAVQYWDYATGNVGIGTTNPAHRLDVAGAVNASASGGLCIAGDCRTSWAQVGGQWTAAAGGPGISYGGGNVGIGTSNPGSPLTVAGAAAHTAPVLDLQGNGDLKLAAQGVIFFDGNYSYGAGTYVGPYSGSSQAYDANTIKITTAGVERLRVTGGGDVGIGTAAPASKLHVAGDVTVDGNISAKFQDVAEWVPSTQKLSAGTVVVLDRARTNHVLASSKAYDTKVAGVVSDSPGVILGVGGEGKLKVATTGRVKVKVDAKRAPVEVGDLLVTSGMEGVAMKSMPVDLGGVQIHRPGTIIGKALEPLDTGTGEILVLLSLQ